VSARGLAFLILLALTGCSVPVAESCEDMSGRQPLDQHNIPEHWGGLRVLPVTKVWGENERVTVISKPPYRALVNGKPRYCVPQAQSTLMLAKVTQNPNDNAANWAIRWVLSIGAGGTRADVKIDALNTQQVSVAGEDIRADLLCEKLIPDATIAWENPVVGVNASATFADGNVTSGQATYTQKFNLAAGASFTFEIPPMATGWRVLGNSTAGATSSPFQALMTYITQGQTVVQMTGDQLTNKDPFISLSGLAKGFRVTNNTANTVIGMLQWGLDL
jgi:hypothetical protein